MLVIDDDPASTTLLAGMFERWGHEDVIVTNDSASAVTICRRSQPDLVLLDLLVPAPVAQVAAPTRRSAGTSSLR